MRRLRCNTFPGAISGLGNPTAPIVGSAPLTNKVKEWLDWTWYDRQSIVTATAATKLYFSAATTSLLASNWQSANAMPAGQAFLATSIRIIPAFGTRKDDVEQILRNCVLTFQVENKLYAQGLAMLFPAGIGTQAELTTGAAAPAGPATGLTTGNHGVPSVHNVYRFKHKVPLRPQQPFTVSLTVDAGIALSATTNVFIAIDGLWQRNIQ